ncbi:hypothetical protein TWF730_001457 [Orbilia blumenaviensis]|uniref:PEST proteolytic signal-containing nuclear protein n=1 Tax=Orbilia blumenaviensis TaxID=1796055 RepID=A0AAV9UIM7_9PEZI
MAEKIDIKAKEVSPEAEPQVKSTTPEPEPEPIKATSIVEKTQEDPKPKAPTSPAAERESSGFTPVQTPLIATVDRRRAREDTPVTIDPKTIGKIRSPNFAQFRGGLGSSSSGKKLRKDLEMSGTPSATPTKNRYAPPVNKADFELDICAKIGAIQWDSDDD